MRVPVIAIVVFIVLVGCNTINPLKKDVDRLTEENARLGTKADRLSTENAGLETQSQRLIQERAELEAYLSRLEKTLESLSSELSSVRIGKVELTQTREDVARDRDALRLRTAQLEDTLNLAEASLREVRGEMERIRNLKDSLEKRNQELALTLRTDTAKIQAQLAEMEAEKQLLHSQLDGLRRELESAREDMASEKAKLTQALDVLKRDLKVQIDRGDVDVLEYSNVIVVNIKDSVLFDPESPLLKESYGDILLAVASAFQNFPDKIVRIEGHTAVFPSRRWASSWDLGAARAVAVARFFQEKAGMDPTRLVALSFGEYRPLASNDTAESRSKNRRVQIVLADRPLYEVQELLRSGR